MKEKPLGVKKDLIAKLKAMATKHSGDNEN